MTRRVVLLGGVLILIAGVVATVRAIRRPASVTVETGSAARRATFRSTVTASGEIVPTRYADIGSSVMGKIVKLPVAEGDRVKAAQILAYIDAVQARSDVSGAVAQTRALQAEAQAAAEQVSAAAADLAAAEARARDAEQQLKRKRELAAQQLIPASELDSSRAGAETAGAQVAASRAALARARRSLDAATGRVVQSQSQQVRADDVLAKTSVVSPIDGIVSRLRVREGEMVVVGIQNQPGTTLMTVSDLSAVNAEVKVAEADVFRLALDQAATVSLEALPGKTFAGRVVEIGASALPVSGTAAAAREFKVVVRLTDPALTLRPGLTCDADIVSSERQHVLTVPLQSVVLRREAPDSPQKSGVFVVRDGRAVFRPVTTGVIGGLDIEVSGLPADAPIVTGPYQALRDLADGALVRPAAKRN